MFRREIRKTHTESSPIPQPVDSNRAEAQVSPVSPLSKFVTATSIQQEITRLGLLAGEMLDLIKASSKIPD